MEIVDKLLDKSSSKIAEKYTANIKKLVANYEKSNNYRTSLKVELEYLIKTLESNPEGALCAMCGKPNIFYDDCGWFYVNIYKTVNSKPEYKAICRNCFVKGKFSTAER